MWIGIFMVFALVLLAVGVWKQERTFGKILVSAAVMSAVGMMTALWYSKGVMSFQAALLGGALVAVLAGGAAGTLLFWPRGSHKSTEP